LSEVVTRWVPVRLVGALGASITSPVLSAVGSSRAIDRRGWHPDLVNGVSGDETTAGRRAGSQETRSADSALSARHYLRQRRARAAARRFSVFLGSSVEDGD
jgi:hypothetical protein